MIIVPIGQMTPLTPLAPANTKGEAGKQGNVSAGSSSVPFSNILSDAMQNLQETQAAAAKDSYDLAMGNVSDLHSVMIRSNQESVAIDTAIQLTSRVVSSYKEIMQMQV